MKKTKYSRPNINEKLQKKNHVKACVGIIAYPKSFKKFPKMNLENAVKIHKRIINLPSSSYKIR